MRVIAGSARGRQLATFQGRSIRPTPDRVREALFSILFSRSGPLSGAQVLDLFAGSGALGIEALSRGAAQAWFVDQAPLAVQTIRANLERCGLHDRATVLGGDVWQTLPQLPAGRFTLILADPPYGLELGPRLLAEIGRRRLLAPGGLCCLETAATDPVPAAIPGLACLDQRRYGSTMIHLFQEDGGEASG